MFAAILSTPMRTLGLAFTALSADLRADKSVSTGKTTFSLSSTFQKTHGRKRPEMRKISQNPM